VETKEKVQLLALLSQLGTIDGVELNTGNKKDPNTQKSIRKLNAAAKKRKRKAKKLKKSYNEESRI
jgi:hypothetical protein